MTFVYSFALTETTRLISTHMIAQKHLRSVRQING